MQAPDTRYSEGLQGSLALMISHSSPVVYASNKLVFNKRRPENFHIKRSDIKGLIPLFVVNFKSPRVLASSFEYCPSHPTPPGCFQLLVPSFLGYFQSNLARLLCQNGGHRAEF